MQDAMISSSSLATDALFAPFEMGPLQLANRFVLAPMTRCFSPGGVPGADVAAYYRRRAEAGVGLLITEGTWIPHPAASNEENAPRFYGEDALAGWSHVLSEVHAAGGKIIPQLWHTGLTRKRKVEFLYDKAEEDLSLKVSPSGYVLEDEKAGEGMSDAEIEDLIEAYAVAAESAERLGFDGFEIHGAHGYMVDQFFWSGTNHRSDRWGGAQISERVRFGVEVVRRCRSRVSANFPILFRFSQWKLQNYGARIAASPAELAAWLEPLADAGVDIFHASQRRFWEPEFPDSDMNLAGWAKKLTGKPSITVGSVGLDQTFLESFVSRDSAEVANLDRLIQMFDRGDFDLVAVGRALLQDHTWVEKVKRGSLDELQPFNAESMATLY